MLARGRLHYDVGMLPRFALLLMLGAAPSAAQIGEVSGYIKGPDGRAVANAVVGFDRHDYKAHLEAKSDKKGLVVVEIGRAHV